VALLSATCLNPNALAGIHTMQQRDAANSYSVVHTVQWECIRCAIFSTIVFPYRVPYPDQRKITWNLVSPICITHVFLYWIFCIFSFCIILNYIICGQMSLSMQSNDMIHKYNVCYVQ